MAKPTLAPHYFKSQDDFRVWLAKNHKTASELLVGYYKVKSGKASLTWSESVDQALCFGWIDGVRRSIDNERYCIRFTPRKQNSIWSAVNIEKMAQLTDAGLMTEDGLKAFSFRTEQKSNIYSHENEPIELAPNLVSQLELNTKAMEYFNNQAPSYKKVIIHWIMIAKQEKTKQARLEKLIHASERQERVV